MFNNLLNESTEKIINSTFKSDDNGLSIVKVVDMSDDSIDNISKHVKKFDDGFVCSRFVDETFNRIDNINNEYDKLNCAMDKIEEVMKEKEDIKTKKTWVRKHLVIQIKKNTMTKHQTKKPKNNKELNQYNEVLKIEFY